MNQDNVDGARDKLTAWVNGFGTKANQFFTDINVDIDISGALKTAYDTLNNLGDKACTIIVKTFNDIYPQWEQIGEFLFGMPMDKEGSVRTVAKLALIRSLLDAISGTIPLEISGTVGGGGSGGAAVANAEGKGGRTKYIIYFRACFKSI